jgi:glycosyltransferase involved in cell wall biosynthesis
MKISLVVPVFNEEETIPIFYEEVRKQETKWKESFGQDLQRTEIVFVNDGSSDATEELLDVISKQDASVQALSFTRNFGKEAALTCGLDFSTGDVVIPMDVDLQDPLDVIPLMLKKYFDGADVVLAKRTDRTTDSFLKRTTAELFYNIHNKISTPPLNQMWGISD